MKLKFRILLFLCLPVWLGSQNTPLPTSQTNRLSEFDTLETLRRESGLNAIDFESKGPRIFSCRVTDLNVNPKKTHEFLVAYASGGLWHTQTNGSSFTSLFDGEASMTIGAIATDWATGTIWVGTGEVNASRSSYAGTGVYVSRDFGKTWQHSGLQETQHIGRILLHPSDPNTIYVAAMGRLYSENPERGFYKSTDGGKTWRQVLYLNDRTGIVDCVMDPQNPEILYAAAWERQRFAWNFVGEGPGSGIYRSTDGGEHWTRISQSVAGFPEGEKCGRIGLTAGVKDGKTIVLALVDNQNRRPVEDNEASPITALSKESFKKMSPSEFENLMDEDLDEYMRSNNFPEKYTPKSVKKMVRTGKIEPAALAYYIEDANAQLFDTPVIGAEVYRFTGQGNWDKTHPDHIDDVYYSYGDYFGFIKAQTDNPDNFYIMGVPILRTTDGGKTFKSVNGENVHVDHHVLWMNPTDPAHLILGNDGGVNMSYDQGESWIRLNRPAVGQFYTVNVDLEDPFNIYGGTQDNGVWKGPWNYSADHRWEMTGRYPYEILMGGDGMQVQIDPRDKSRIVYTGYQFGNYFRIDTRGGKRSYITPKPDLGDRPYRWNWQTPIWLSLHNPDIFYMGSQKLLRSMNQGETFTEISDDLTQGGRPGNVPFGTLTAIHESPLKFGLLYVGSDDGLVHVTRDGGYSWQRITEGLPTDLWVSRVVASAHVEGRVYISLNGYRQDHFEPYIFQSDDYGATWKRLGLDLPTEPVNVIREDPVNPDLLYVGTDHGLYVSLNQGTTFVPFDGGLPNVAVHDLVIHPKQPKLIAGTHGRSFYVADIEPLQLMTPTLLGTGGHLFAISPIKHSSNWGKARRFGEELNDPEVSMMLYLSEDIEVAWKLTQDESEIVLHQGSFQGKKGLNKWTIRPEISTNREKWVKSIKDEALIKLIKMAPNLLYYLPPGKYNIQVKAGKKAWTETLVIE